MNEAVMNIVGEVLCGQVFSVILGRELGVALLGHRTQKTFKDRIFDKREDITPVKRVVTCLAVPPLFFQPCK